MLNLFAEEEKSMQTLLAKISHEGQLAKQANCGRDYFARRPLQL